MTAHRVLVCGDRNWDSLEYLYAILDAYHAAYPIETLIEGEARGADAMAREWAKSRGIPYEPYAALWDLHGRSAGPRRNRVMLHKGRPDTVLAFHRNLDASKGTKDMVTIAREAGVPVYIVPFEGVRPWWSPVP